MMPYKSKADAVAQKSRWYAATRPERLKSAKARRKKPGVKERRRETDRDLYKRDPERFRQAQKDKRSRAALGKPASLQVPKPVAVAKELLHRAGFRAYLTGRTTIPAQIPPEAPGGYDGALKPRGF